VNDDDEWTTKRGFNVGGVPENGPKGASNSKTSKII